MLENHKNITVVFTMCSSIFGRTQCKALSCFVFMVGDALKHIKPWFAYNFYVFNSFKETLWPIGWQADWLAGRA